MEINKLHCSACFYRRDSAHPARKWPGPLGTSAHRVKQGINDPPPLCLCGSTGRFRPASVDSAGKVQQGRMMGPRGIDLGQRAARKLTYDSGSRQRESAEVAHR
jgi:hypothetical protein